MASRKPRSPVSAEPHRVRLIQAVPTGTPGAVVDSVTGRSFVATWLDGGKREPGWSQADVSPVLNDTSEFSIIIPPVGPDGKQAADRFYCLSDSRDPSSGARSLSYMPGDEWLEVYREPQEIVACGTPISVQVQQEQVQVTCRDVLQPLKKTRETGGGFWCHAPRDVFEHYSRLWLPVISDDFPDSLTQFPSSPGGASITPDGRWSIIDVSNQGGPSVARLHGGSGSLIGNNTGNWPNTTATHGAWRAEARISAASRAWTGTDTIVFQVRATDGSYARIVVSLASIAVQTFQSSTSTSWPTNPTGLTDSSGLINTPLTLAIEARDRWLLFYANGSLIGVAPSTEISNTTLTAQVLNTSPSGTAYVDVDYIVVRDTSPPLNGGQPGDYRLPSVPAAGGLTGEYFNMPVPIYSTWSAPGNEGYKVGERVDAFPLAGGGTPPTWQMAAAGNGVDSQFAVRWSGAIYLPLDVQDIHITIPVSDISHRPVWIGKTRWNEWVATRTGTVTSVGLRSLFGNVPGWYPIVIEYSYLSGSSNPNLTWDVGGTGTPIPADHLAPLGCYRGQVPAGDSHYDTVRAISDQFAYQFRSTPQRLESGQFPGSLTPQVRVGRDTASTLTIDDAISPQLTVNYEDVATALLAAAQGLGGNSSGGLTLEAFDFANLTKHPFVSQESENLPTISVEGQLLYTLLTLLGERTSGWEDLQTQVPGSREKTDTFPLTGVLAEFDWQPGDALRVKAPAITVEDVLPRQIFQLARTIYPDGVGDTKVSFRPRNRDPLTTLRKFIRQVYGSRRAFQGQFVTAPGIAATDPGAATAVLPADLSNVRSCDLVVVSKDNSTTPFDIAINGVATGLQITGVGRTKLGGYVARNTGQQQMIVTLTNHPGDGTHCQYHLDLTTLIPAI